MKTNKYTVIIAIFFLLVSNVVLGQFGENDFQRTDRLMHEDEFLGKVELFEDLQSRSNNCACEYFDLENGVNLNFNNTLITNYLGNVEIANRLRDIWITEQRNRLKDKIDDFFGIEFEDFEKAIDRLLLKIIRNELVLKVLLMV